MKVYEWSPNIILEYVKLGDLAFNEEEFLRECAKRIKAPKTT
jgi:hypothetical protein